ncbi:MAG TPA: queuosine salvage family protein [Ktedonobacteraceae bacterium]|nr:queuosine salvage family protein [Ktedonobacteraceae bacterium]
MINESQMDPGDDEEALHPTSDPLGVLSSANSVITQGELVWINSQRVVEVARRWSQERTTHAPDAPAWPAAYERYHFFDGTERSANWILALDAMNFCFWAEQDQPRWRITYKGETLNGYLAEAAALTRAIEDGLPLWDAAFLAQLSSETLASIFRGEQTIPLFEQRLQNAREVGRVLLEQFDGQFTNVITAAESNAVKLALLITLHFSSFHDVALYRGQPVRFYKRAQLCVSDIQSAFKGQSWGKITDMDQLTAFADYKVPQALRHFGILDYAPELAQQVDSQSVLAEGSEEEIEIRAATIWACEFLRRQLLTLDYPLTAAEIDQRLWLLAQNSADMRPYHRTRTQFY